MRDRLIELIDDFIHSIDVSHWYSEELDEKLADHLLANGIIVPPCAAEDTVYWISSDGHIVKSKLATITTVFLTKEEAEKALVERAKET